MPYEAMHFKFYQESQMMDALKKIYTLAMHHKLSELDGLHQRHAGQECYIFGDGISLKWMDLNQFTDRLSIVGSFLVYHKEAKKLRMAYCPMIEPFFFWPAFIGGGQGNSMRFRNSLYKEYRKTIKQHPETLFFLDISDYPVTRFPNALYVSRFYTSTIGTTNPFRDRKDLHHASFKFQVALAIYLGFKKAYLVGHDYTHNPARSFHFYEKGEGILGGNKDFCREFIDYAKKYIDLVTVTLDGGSETIEPITYKELTGKEPKFRENYDLVERSKLESLATWQGYTIF